MMTPTQKAVHGHGVTLLLPLLSKRQHLVELTPQTAVIILQELAVSIFESHKMHLWPSGCARALAACEESKRSVFAGTRQGIF